MLFQDLLLSSFVRTQVTWICNSLMNGFNVDLQVAFEESFIVTRLTVERLLCYVNHFLVSLHMTFLCVSFTTNVTRMSLI